MNEPNNTQKIYSEDGVYRQERRETHQEIIGYFFKDEENPLSPPEAILLGGGSAVGKSTIRDFFLLSYQDNEIPIVVIDSDSIKEYLPEYEEMLLVDQEEAAKFVHDESSDISSNLLAYCIDESKNFIYDGTMKNLQKYKGIIEKAKSEGYKVTIVVVDVPLEIAKKRAHARFLETGRQVPEEVLEKSHREVPKVFQVLKDIVDEYLLLDMTGDVEPHDYIATKINGVEEVHNTEKYEKFLNKGCI